MKTNQAIDALSALAQETRLALFRELVRHGSDGMAAGDLGRRLGIPNATLSFHLKELKAAGLIGCTRIGRSLVYAANFDAMRDLVGYLLDDCCRGAVQVA